MSDGMDPARWAEEGSNNAKQPRAVKNAEPFIVRQKEYWETRLLIYEVQNTPAPLPNIRELYLQGLHDRLRDLKAEIEELRRTDWRPGLNTIPDTDPPLPERETHCPKCGWDWEAHEFAVPAPYCPGGEEDAARNRDAHARFMARLNKATEAASKRPFGERK